RLVKLLLREVGIHDTAKPIGGGRVLIERLLVELLGLGIMFLDKLDVPHLNIGSRTLWGSLHGLLGVLLGIAVMLAGDLRNAFQKKAVRRIRLSGNDLWRGLPDGIDIAAAQLQGSQGALRVAQVRTDANSLAPLRLCAAVIVL